MARQDSQAAHEILSDLTPSCNVLASYIIYIYEMEASPAEDAPAPFLRRAAAYLIDSLFIGLLWVLSNATTAVVLGPDSEASEAVSTVLLFCVPAAWFFYQWASNSTGASIGKKIMSLSIRSSSGRATPGIRRGLVRTLGQALGAAPLGLGFWWALWDGKKQAWHDKIAGTHVVRYEAEVSLADDVLATFPRRAAAYFIDSLTVSMLWVAALSWAALMSTAAGHTVEEGDEASEAVGMALFFAAPAIWFFYHWVSNSIGTSAGKKIMSLSIRPSEEGTSPGMRRGLVRTLGQALGMAPLGLGFWWALWGGKNQAWHDKLAETHVVRTPRMLEGHDDRSALKEALEEPLPLGAADVPLDVTMGPLPRSAHHAAAFALGLSSLVAFHAMVGFAFDLSTLMIVIGEILLAIASGLPELSGLNRRLRISGEGIRLEKVYGTRSILWWQIGRLEAKPDLSYMRALGSGVKLSCDCRSLPLAKRKEIAIAIRARLPSGMEIQEWSKEGRFFSYARSSGLSGAALALLLVSSIIGASAPEHVLGLRCGVSSHYLRERFGLPEERGCVVLRVSGAAQQAGLQQGDMMIGMNGIPITSGPQFSILFENSGESVFTFTVLRPGSAEPTDFVVELGPGSPPPEEDPNDPFFYYLRARWDTARTHIERDIEDYTRAIELAPDFDLAYLYRGGLYFELGDRDAARQDYTRALELDPDLSAAHRSLTYLFFADGDLGSAMASIEKAIVLDECEDGFIGHNIDCAEDFYLLAATYAYPDFPKGIEAAQKSIELYPHFPEPYYQLAYFYDSMGEREKAQEYARRYLTFPDSKLKPEKVQEMTDILLSS